jgi:regulatory protein YycH of two-component signal transduction system YycFG
MSPVRLGISAVLGALLVLVSGYLLVMAWRSKPDFAPVNEPEQLLTPSELGVG